MQDTKVLAAASLLAVALVSANAFASDPAGVWVKVQEVVYAPDAIDPTHVQVHGALMLYDGDVAEARPYPGYTSPALGYMYYRCPDGQAETCRQEWRDLEANIAEPDSECIGFGMMSLPTGTLRKPGTEAESPDVYPIQNGVSPGFSPCQAIANYLSEQTSAGGAGGVGGATASGGTDTDTGGTPASTGDAGSAGEAPTNGSSGSVAIGTGKGGATAGGRTGSGTGDPETPAVATKAADSGDQVAGCSVAATGAASLFGLGAALGIGALALARRSRRRK
jgi:hypothetical protein